MELEGFAYVSGFMRRMLILSKTPGLKRIDTVPFTWTCSMLYGPSVLSPNFVGSLTFLVLVDLRHNHSVFPYCFLLSSFD